MCTPVSQSVASVCLRAPMALGETGASWHTLNEGGLKRSSSGDLEPLPGAGRELAQPQ